MVRSIEEILKEIKNRGLFLSGLYERRTYPAHPNTPGQSLGVFRACITNKNGHRDEDEGATATEALEECLERAKGLKGPENRPVVTAPPKAETASLDDLL